MEDDRHVRVQQVWRRNSRSQVTRCVLRDESVDSDAELERSVIYMPDVWSLLDQEQAASVKRADVAKSDSVVGPKSDKKDEVNLNDSDRVDSDAVSTSAATSDVCDDLTSSNAVCSDPPDDVCTGGDNTMSEVASIATEAEVPERNDLGNGHQQHPLDAVLQEKRDFLQRIPDLKVTELKVELEKRHFKYNPKYKKADLVAILKEKVQHEIDSTTTDLNDSVSEKCEQAADTIVSYESIPSADAADQQPVQPMDTSSEAQLPGLDLVNNEEVEVKPAVVVDSSSTDKVDKSTEDKPAKGQKRSLDSSASKSSSSSSSKRSRTDDEAKEEGVIEVVSSNQLNVVNLYQALGHPKYDHFEVSMLHLLFSNCF